MKKLIFAALMSSIIFASPAPVKVVNVQSGSLAYCKKKSDVYRGRFQAYLVDSVELDYDEEYNLSLFFSVKMKSCRELSEGKFGFVEVNPRKKFNYSVAVGYDDVTQSLKYNDVTAQTINMKGLMYRDGEYKVFANSAIGENVRMKISLFDVLSEKELNDLQDGKSVKSNFDFTLQRTMVLSDKTGILFKKKFNYAAFRFHFTVKRNQDNSYSLTR